MPNASASAREQPRVNVKIGNTADCLKAISTAITKKAYEIYRMRGGTPGHEREDWQLAEKEVLRPTCCCGILESKDGSVISMLPSALGVAGISDIEFCAEPRRLLIKAKRAAAPESENATVYRVLPLRREFDASSLKLRPKEHGSLIEIEMRESRRKARPNRRAA